MTLQVWSRQAGYLVDKDRTTGTDFRIIILAQLELVGKSRYWLAVTMGDKISVTPRSVYRYLNGESQLAANVVGEILDLLGLSVNPSGLLDSIPYPKDIKT